jgi:predicted nucleic acid-binding protein
VSVVVDAAAMVEIVQSSPTGRAVASRLVGEAVAAPDVIDVEVASAIRRQQRAGRMDEDEVSRALDLLLDWPADRIPSRLLVRGTRRWWPNVTAYDALYLAVAVARQGRVLTCDGRLARAPAVGVPVENVRVTGNRRP